MRKNDIVQITDDSHPWYPSLVVIDEVKGWGIQGFCFIPHNDHTPTGQVFIRLYSHSYEKVGSLVVAPEPEDHSNPDGSIEKPLPSPVSDG